MTKVSYWLENRQLHFLRLFKVSAMLAECYHSSKLFLAMVCWECTSQKKEVKNLCFVISQIGFKGNSNNMFAPYNC